MFSASQQQPTLQDQIAGIPLPHAGKQSPSRRGRWERSSPSAGAGGWRSVRLRLIGTLRPGSGGRIRSGGTIDRCRPRPHAYCSDQDTSAIQPRVSSHSRQAVCIAGHQALLCSTSTWRGGSKVRSSSSRTAITPPVQPVERPSDRVPLRRVTCRDSPVSKRRRPVTMLG
jgi:hypothetical protein